MATRPLVVIPWRATPDRLDARDLASQAWQAMGFQELLVDSGHERFNLAASRNLGVRIAEDRHGQDAPVVVADADTFGEPEPITAAIDAARHTVAVHLPYTEYRSLGRIGISLIRSDTPPSECPGLTVPGACSGIFVASPSSWWRIGGMDERFTVWSPEDWSFRLAHETLVGLMPRHEGRAYALGHADPPGKAAGPEYDACVELYQRYVDAHHQPTSMLALVNLWPVSR